ncbi:MAG: hypothetical protein AAFQ35_03835 [Pseudomonadota bacterium]
MRQVRQALSKLLLTCGIAVGGILAGTMGAHAQIVNTATVTGSPAAGTLPTTTATESVTVVAANPSVETTKTVVVAPGGSNPPVAGDTLNYTITIQNTGNVTLVNVGVASDTLERLDTGNTALTLGAITFVSNSGSSPQGQLAPLETATFTASYTLVQADIDAGGVQNQATGTGEGPAGGSLGGGTVVTDDSDDGIDTDGNTADDPTQTIIPNNALIALVKTGSITDVNTNGRTDANDTITYTYTVTNTGNVTLFDIAVAELDTAPNDQFTGNGTTPTPAYDAGGTNEGGNATLLDLLPGASMTFEATYTLVQADIDQGGVANQARATGNDPAGTPVTDDSDESSTAAGQDDPTNTPITRSPLIALVKTGTVNDAAAPTGLSANDTITYTYTVTNTGNTTLFDIGVTELDTAPTDEFTGNGTAPTPTFNAGGTDEDGQGDAADLVPGASLTFQATYTIVQADIDQGSVANQARANGTDPQNNSVTDDSDESSTAAGDDDPTVTPLTATPLIGLVKSATQNPGADGILQAGETITYTYTVTNEGNTTLFDVTVAENAGTFTGTFANLTTPTRTAGGGDIDGEADAFDLAVGNGTITFEATYTVTQADILNGSVTNQAVATGTPPSGPAVTDNSDESTPGAGDNDPTVSTITPQPRVTLAKVADNDTNRAAGDEIVYTYTIENTGNVPINSVSVNDTHNAQNPVGSPENETLDNDGGVATGDSTDATANNGTWDVLAPGDRITIQRRYTVTQSDVDLLQ